MIMCVVISLDKTAFHIFPLLGPFCMPLNLCGDILVI